MANNIIGAGTVQVNAHVAPFESAVNGAISRVEKRKVTVPFALDLGRITGDFRKFEQSLDSATARVIAFTATTSLIYGLGSAFQRLVSDAIKIESVMVKIQSIFGSTNAETKKFQNEIFNLANATSTSFYQVAEAAEEFSRQGLSLSKTLDATRAAIVISKLSGTDLKNTIEGLTATLSTFADSSLDYIDVANKLVALDAAFATSAGGITEGLKRVSGVAAQAGLTFDETAAAITALKQVTGRSEAVIGNSLKSIFTSLQTEKVQKELNSLGVETQDATGEFRNLLDVLSDLSKVYSTLGDAQKALIAQKIGKTYQANAFQGILRSFETGNFQKALGISQGADDEGLERIDKINKTTESALVRFGNNITKLGGNLGDQLGKPILDKVVGYFNQIIDAGNSIFGGQQAEGVAKKFSIGDALVAGIKNALEGPGLLLATIAITRLLGRIIKETGQAIGAVSGLANKTQNIGDIQNYVTNTLQATNQAELQRINLLTTVEARQKAIVALIEQQLKLSQLVSSVPGPVAKGYGLNTLPSGQLAQIAKRIPNRASGDIDAAMLRESVAISQGVGGARPSARPQLKYLNLGNGLRPVVVNSDEKIVKNYADSGLDAVLNRTMMGHASGFIPDETSKERAAREKLERDLETLRRENKRRQTLADKRGYAGIDVVKSIGGPLGKLGQYSDDPFSQLLNQAKQNILNPSPVRTSPPFSFSNKLPKAKPISQRQVATTSVNYPYSAVPPRIPATPPPIPGSSSRVNYIPYNNSYPTTKRPPPRTPTVAGPGSFRHGGLPFSAAFGEFSALPANHVVSEGLRLKKISNQLIKNQGSFGPLGGALGTFGGSLSRDDKRFALENQDRLSQQARDSIAGRKESNSRRYSAFNIGFAAPLIGGFASQFATGPNGEPTRASELIQKGTQNLGSAALLGTFSKKAGVVGGIVAAIDFVNDALGESATSFQKYGQQHQSLIGEFNKESEALKNYQQSFTNLSDVIASGSSKNIEAATKSLADALGSISDPALISKLGKITDISSLSSLVAENEASNKKSLVASEFVDNAAQLRINNKQGFFGQLLNGKKSASLQSNETDKLAKQLAQTVDISKLSAETKKGLPFLGTSVKGAPQISDILSEEALEGFKLLEPRFKNTYDIVFKLGTILEKQLEATTKGTKQAEQIVSQRASQIKLETLITASLQKAQVSVLERGLSRQSAFTKLQGALESRQGILSEEAFAKASYKVGLVRQGADASQKIQSVNSNILDKANDSLKGKTISTDQLSVVQGAFDKFGKDQDISSFLQAFKDVLGTDFQQLSDYANAQLLELQKIAIEQKAARVDAKSALQQQLEAIRRGQRSVLFGGANALGRYDASKVLPGLAATLKKPAVNKYNDPSNPGFGRGDYGQRLFSDKEYGAEEDRALRANVSSADAIIQRAQYLKENGLLGVSGPNQKEYVDFERDKLAEAYSTKARVFQRDDIQANTSGYLSSINEDAKKITGSAAFNGPQQEALKALLSNDKYGEASDLVKDITGGLRSRYALTGKDKELGNIDQFSKYLQFSGDNFGSINKAAQERAAEALPYDNIDKQLQELINLNNKTDSSNSILASIEQRIAEFSGELNFSKTVDKFTSLNNQLASSQAAGQSNSLSLNSIKEELLSSLSSGYSKSNNKSIKDTYETILGQLQNSANSKDVKKVVSDNSDFLSARGINVNSLNSRLQGEVEKSTTSARESENINSLIRTFNDNQQKQIESIQKALQPLVDSILPIFQSQNNKQVSTDQSVNMGVQVELRGTEFAEKMSNQISQAVNSQVKLLIDEAIFNATGKKAIFSSVIA